MQKNVGLGKDNGVITKFVLSDKGIEDEIITQIPILQSLELATILRKGGQTIGTVLATVSGIFGQRVSRLLGTSSNWILSLQPYDSSL